jgi:hypothetical protein
MPQRQSIFVKLSAHTGRRLVVIVPLLWLAVFFMLPLAGNFASIFYRGDAFYTPLCPFMGL